MWGDKNVLIGAVLSATVYDFKYKIKYLHMYNHSPVFLVIVGAH